MEKTGKIIINGMSFFGYHGVFRPEKELGQKFIVDLEMILPYKKTLNDDISNTVDYYAVYKYVQSIVCGKETYKLIETLADKIATGILGKFDVEEIMVRIKKPHACLPGIFDFVAYELIKNKNEI